MSRHRTTILLGDQQLVIGGRKSELSGVSKGWLPTLHAPPPPSPAEDATHDMLVAVCKGWEKQLPTDLPQRAMPSAEDTKMLCGRADAEIHFVSCTDGAWGVFSDPMDAADFVFESKEAGCLDTFGPRSLSSTVREIDTEATACRLAGQKPLACWCVRSIHAFAVFSHYPGALDWLRVAAAYDGNMARIDRGCLADVTSQDDWFESLFDDID